LIHRYGGFTLALFLCFRIYSADDGRLAQEGRRYALVTVLYNETNTARIAEYKICLERNLAHPAIASVCVIYDSSQDDEECALLQYLRSKLVEIRFIGGCYEDLASYDVGTFSAR